MQQTEAGKVQANLGNLTRPFLKIQKGWECSSAIECLLNRHAEHSVFSTEGERERRNR